MIMFIKQFTFCCFVEKKYYLFKVSAYKNPLFKKCCPEVKDLKMTFNDASRGLKILLMLIIDFKHLKILDHIGVGMFYIWHIYILSGCNLYNTKAAMFSPN